MTLREQLDAHLKEAMRAKEQLRVDTIRAVKSAVKYKEVEGGEAKALDDAGIVKVVQSEMKKRRDASEQYRAANRVDLAEKEERELAILQVYLPQQLSAEEVEQLVAEAIAETGATSPKDMGAVMKAVQPKTAGRADGKLVSELVKKKLAGA
ncbi:MAG: hypothetical protein RL199_259 [Pseudomonadota bacterium]|jgi:uncharacterized protein YqeY